MCSHITSWCLSISWWPLDFWGGFLFSLSNRCPSLNQKSWSIRNSAFYSFSWAFISHIFFSFFFPFASSGKCRTLSKSKIKMLTFQALRWKQYPKHCQRQPKRSVMSILSSQNGCSTNIAARDWTRIMPGLAKHCLAKSLRSINQ